MKRRKIKIYTDGSYLPSKDKGGWASLIDDGENKIMLFGSDTETTNNRMEMKAVLEALKEIKEPSDITITSDSTYVLNPIDKKWLNTWEQNDWKKSDRTPVKNIEMWKELKKELKKHKVKTVWVEGHSGHFENELCDDIARSEAEKEI